MNIESSSRGKKIAANTVFLYARMLLIMVVQFFTVRVTLKYLGVEDYGIYNVVCGVTNVFTFLTHTMTSASQRFLAYDLGVGNMKKLKCTFDTLVSLFTLCGLIGVFLLGTIGTWFIKTHLVIPEARLDAALFAFYFTLLALLVSLYVLPFNSLIIAHEDMKTFAYVSIVDALLKLGVVYCLVIIPIDKLMVYSVLIFIAYLIPSVVYVIYCHCKYSEVTWKSHVDWGLTKKIVPFMSWNLLGGLSWMLCTQGLSIVINMFFGPVANAAKAIADKVSTSINGFSNNFMMAVQPQVVKTYAAQDYASMHKVIFLASRLSFYLTMVLVIPVSICADGILSIWLESHDELTTIMLQVILMFSLVGALEIPINQAIRATGDIRNYQIYIGLITFFVIPAAWGFFKLGFPAYYGYIALIIVYSIAYVARLYYLKKQIHISYGIYFNEVLKYCIKCLLFSIVLYLVVEFFHANVWLHSILLWGCCSIFQGLIVIVFGFKREERNKFKLYIYKRIKSY